VLIVAHRGAHDPESPGIRENTLAAFRAAADLGADGIELDVRATRSGALAIHHDAAVALAEGDRAIGDLDTLPSWLPVLDDALDACRPLRLVNVEIKASPVDTGYREVDVAAVARAVGRAPVPVAVSSFNLLALDAFKAAAPDVPTAWLTMSRYDQLEAVSTAAEHGHQAINPPDPATTAEVIAAAHAAGLEVMVWTVNDGDRMRELAAWGADVLITDRPALAVSLLR
jgi:glycerophosphoryl diester phosphodiesterase